MLKRMLNVSSSYPREFCGGVQQFRKKGDEFGRALTGHLLGIHIGVEGLAVRHDEMTADSYPDTGVSGAHVHLLTDEELEEIRQVLLAADPADAMVERFTREELDELPLADPGVNPPQLHEPREKSHQSLIAALVHTLVEESGVREIESFHRTASSSLMMSRIVRASLHIRKLQLLPLFREANSLTVSSSRATRRATDSKKQVN